MSFVFDPDAEIQDLGCLPANPANPANPAGEAGKTEGRLATLAGLAGAHSQNSKSEGRLPFSTPPDLMADGPVSDPAAPLPPAAKARRQKVLAIQARDGTHYAVLVEDPNTDPVIAALATPDGTCEALIPKDRYDPFAVLAMVEAWRA
jgi:hypothetical protein